jgi:hypothetical protein
VIHQQVYFNWQLIGNDEVVSIDMFKSMIFDLLDRPPIVRQLPVSARQFIPGEMPIPGIPHAAKIHPESSARPSSDGLTG